MRRIGLAGTAGGAFFRLAESLLNGKNAVLETWNPQPEYDAVLILPGSLPCGSVIRCAILIAPDESEAVETECKSVISYGMSPRNTLTISSIAGEKYVIALQRDAVTLDGELILRQEFPVACGLPPYEALALAALAVIAGCCEIK